MLQSEDFAKFYIHFDLEGLLFVSFTTFLFPSLNFAPFLHTFLFWSLSKYCSPFNIKSWKGLEVYITSSSYWFCFWDKNFNKNVFSLIWNTPFSAVTNAFTWVADYTSALLVSIKLSYTLTFYGNLEIISWIILLLISNANYCCVWYFFYFF